MYAFSNVVNNAGNASAFRRWDRSSCSRSQGHVTLEAGIEKVLSLNVLCLFNRLSCSSSAVLIEAWASQRSARVFSFMFR